ncbi:MAG: AI-2E family transporter [Aggregatilineales bacterium]
MDQKQISSYSEFPPWMRSWWAVVSVMAISLIVAVIMLATVVLLIRPFALLFLAISIAAALSPIIDRLSRIMSHSIAILITYLFILLALVLFTVVLAPRLATQLQTFIDQLPALVEQSEQFLNRNQTLSSLLDRIAASAGQIGQQVVEVPVSVLTGLFDSALVLVVSLYLLLSASNIKSFLLSLFGGDLRQQISGIGTEILDVLGGYIRGLVINMLLIATLTSVGLTLIGIPYAFVLGVFAGLMEALPVVGSLIAGTIVLLVALVQSPTTFLITLAFVLLVQQIEGNVIAPNVMQRQASVPRFLVPLAVLAGGILYGVLGALISVPLIAVLKVIILRVFAPFIRNLTHASPPKGSHQEQTTPVRKPD